MVHCMVRCKQYVGNTCAFVGTLHFTAQCDYLQSSLHPGLIQLTYRIYNTSHHHTSLTWFGYLSTYSKGFGYIAYHSATATGCTTNIRSIYLFATMSRPTLDPTQPTAGTARFFLRSECVANGSLPVTLTFECVKIFHLPVKCSRHNAQKQI